MLILTRKRGQALFLEQPKCAHCAPNGKLLQIVVLGRHQDDIKIGIDAPKEFIVQRDNAREEINKKGVKQLDLFTD